MSPTVALTMPPPRPSAITPTPSHDPFTRRRSMGGARARHGRVLGDTGRVRRDPPASGAKPLMVHAFGRGRIRRAWGLADPPSQVRQRKQALNRWHAACGYPLMPQAREQRWTMNERLSRSSQRWKPISRPARSRRTRCTGSFDGGSPRCASRRRTPLSPQRSFGSRRAAAFAAGACPTAPSCGAARARTPEVPA